ncbi:MAG: recombinase zinc beta ribbon domain-containing protein, partial [Clostridiales bacterium]|nr:recombinase zinc beta ribbon domain-containing protein [Clostridiales bacterium]
CSDSIKNIILNPKYKGFYCSGKTASIDYKQTKRLRLDADEWNVYKDENIPAIVSEEIWNSANELYKIRGEKSKKNSGAYLQRYSFSGKLICAEHQTSFHRHVYKNKNGGKEVWNCKLYRQKGKHDGCDSPTIYSSELQKILDEIYSEIYDDKEKVISGLLEIYSAAEVVDYSKEISDAEKVLSKLQKTKDQLLELLVEKIISKQEFKERNDAANSAIKKNEDEISSLRSHKNTQVDITLLEKTMRHEFAKLNSEFNETLLDKIIVHKINESPAHINLEIHLNIGDGKNCISLHQIGISQAQVSRLEKNALKNMRKYIS